MKIGSSHSLVRARNVIIVDLVEPPTQSPAEVELWGAVLCRAIEDLTGHSWTADCFSSERVRIQREVREWFTSRRKSQGSFETIWSPDQMPSLAWAGTKPGGDSF
jgi:hypothetical protein